MKISKFLKNFTSNPAVNSDKGGRIVLVAYSELSF